VVHGLLRRQPRDGRQHAKRIGGQEHYIVRMAANSRNQGVLNEIHRVSRARIFRQTDVGKNPARAWSRFRITFSSTDPKRIAR